MKRIMVVLAVLLLSVSFAWGIPKGQKVGQVRGQVVSDELAKPRIEIDADQMQFSGNYGYWLRDNLAAMMRVRIGNTGLVGIAVTGRQFDQVAATQDRIHKSGRYSEASRSQVPQAAMVAPTETFVLTGTADVKTKDNRLSFSIGGQHIDAGRRKVSATVRITVEQVNIAKGLNGRSYEVEGYASRTDGERLSVSEWQRYGNFSRDTSSSTETDVILEATSQAVDKLLAQFQAPEPPPAPSRLASR